MRSVRLTVAVLVLALLACGGDRRLGQGTSAADTTRDRPDTTTLRRPSPTDTVRDASLEDTTRRSRPLGMQRPGGTAQPMDPARRDSVAKR